MKKRRRLSMFLYVPFWMLIVGAFTGLLITQMSRHEYYRRDLERLQAELAREQQIAYDLKYRRAFYESDAYIEQLARERLGFVRQDEIIFQNIAN